MSDSNVIDLQAERVKRQPRFRALTEKPHWHSPCARCGRELGEGMILTIGSEAYHGRKGKCRNAALRLLTPDECERAERARANGIWWMGHGHIIGSPSVAPIPGNVQTAFPPREVVAHA